MTEDFNELLPHDAPRDTWLAQRQKGIGGSDAPAVAGLDRYSSRLRVYLDKTSHLPPQQYTAAMEFGHRAEPMIREWFTELTGVQVETRGLLQSRENPWQLYTPDGLCDDGGLLEMKTTNAHLAYEWADGAVSDRAALQGQHGLKVTMRTHVWVAALVGVELHIRRVERDEALIEDLTALEDDFWHGHVLPQVPPPLGHVADPELIRRLHPHADGQQVELDADALAALDEYRSTGEQIKALKQVQDAAQARVCAALGSAATGTAEDRTVVTWRNTGPFSEERLREDEPDMHRAYTATVPAFDKGRFVQDHPELYTAYRSRRFNPSKG